MKNSEEKNLSWKKILLIILTVFILAPIVLFGSCLSIELIAVFATIDYTQANFLSGGSFMLFFGFWVISFPIAIFVFYKVIKKIKSYSRENVASTN
jgi:ABC-type spermidine/putrescine transport system permease subunit II